MKLTAPKQITFWIAVVIAALGIIVKLGVIPTPAGSGGGWLVLIAFAVLALGNLIEAL